MNVHPTKVEVRFRDGHRIYSQLLSTVRQTFLTSDLHAKLQTPEPFAARRSVESRAPPRRLSAPAPPFALNEADRPSPGGRGLVQPEPVVRLQDLPAARLRGRAGCGRLVATPRPRGPVCARRLFDEFAPTEASTTTAETARGASNLPSVRSREAGTRARRSSLSHGPLKALQVHDSYLIAETDDGMMVIDQHALHERILYEELRKRVERGSIESQRLLVPEPVHLNASEAAAVVEHRETLRQLGLDVEPFGGDTVLVTSAPAMLQGVAPDRLLRDLAEHLRTGRSRRPATACSPTCST